jgi:diguanylate cyclase (GGDEF)-like protein/PAS domain S-box-containing protein
MDGESRTAQGVVERLVDAVDLPIGRWDRALRLVYCNRPYTAWAERTRDELIGRSIADLYGPAAAELVQPHFAAAFGGATVRYDRLLTHRAGPARWGRVHVFPDAGADGQVDGVYTVATDIHDDVLIRDELRAARRQLARFTDNIPYPLTYVDRHFVLRFVNRAYVLASGTPAEELLGRRIGDVRGPRKWDEHRSYFERALRGETCEYTRLTQLADQGPRWVRTTYSPDLDDHGAVAGIYTSTVDVHDITLAQQALRRSLERDALTDVLSRRALMDAIEHAIGRCPETPVGLFFVDLDGFKGVNDRFGHRSGDALLASVARELTAAVRGDDVVGRFGGDEFVVLARLGDAAAARVLAGHLLDAVRRGSAPLQTPRPITASVGFALAPRDVLTAYELVRRADEAMYAAKHAGGDRAVHCADLDRGAPA